MLTIQLLTVFPLLYSFACAKVIPRETSINSFRYVNTTSTLPATAATTPKCCFLVQDVVSQVWWEQTAYQLTTKNITSLSYFVTRYPNTTVTNINSTVTTTVITNSDLVGANPITLIDNEAPGPTETATSLNATGAITTGGVVIQSPAAFFVYSTVRVITANALQGNDGSFRCAAGADDDEGRRFQNINSNAQAYFGGGVPEPTLVEALTTSDPVNKRVVTTSPTPTPADTPSDTTIPLTPDPVIVPAGNPTPTVLSLTEPFVYAPGYGATGRKVRDSKCRTRGGTEEYGFIPQTLFDYLTNNQHYMSQYPGLQNCVPAGPSILPALKACPAYYASTQVGAVGGDLTAATVIYVTPPGISGPEKTPGAKEPDKGSAAPITDDKPGKGGDGNNAGSGEGDNSGKGNTGKGQGQGNSDINGITNGGSQGNGNTNNGNSNDGNSNNGNSGSNDGVGGGSSKGTPFSFNPGQGNSENNGGQGNSGNINAGSGSSQPQFNNEGEGQEDASIGEIINLIIGGPTKADTQRNGGQSNQGFENRLPGEAIVFSAATVIPTANAPPGVTAEIKTVNGVPVYNIAGPTTIAAPPVLPFGGAPIGSTKVIAGTPYIVIPGPTSIPVANAPVGLQGSTTNVGGTPFIVIPGSQTYAAPQITGAPHGKSTLINGVPFIVYPKTDIPLAEAAAYGITAAAADATKTINGTPYLALAGPTTVPALAYDSDAAAFGGKTTLINNTPYLLLPSSTPIPASAFPSGLPGAKTTSINGTPYLIVPSATTVPLPLATDRDSTRGGQLTVIIDGSSRLIIAGPTTVPVNSEFDIEGSKTVIGGTTMVVVSAPTTVAAKKTSSSSTSSTTSAEATRSANPPQPVPTTEEAPNSGVEKVEVRLVLVLGVLALAVVL